MATGGLLGEYRMSLARLSQSLCGEASHATQLRRPTVSRRLLCDVEELVLLASPRDTCLEESRCACLEARFTRCLRRVSPVRMSPVG